MKGKCYTDKKGKPIRDGSLLKIFVKNLYSKRGTKIIRKIYTYGIVRLMDSHWCIVHLHKKFDSFPVSVGEMYNRKAGHLLTSGLGRQLIHCEVLGDWHERE